MSVRVASANRHVAIHLSPVQGFFETGERFERLDVDDDYVGGRPGSFSTLRRHQNYRLSPVPNLSLCQNGLIRNDLTLVFEPRHVILCQDRLHSGHRQSRRDVDARDPTVWDIDPPGGPPQHAFGMKITHVGEPAGHLRYSIGTPNGLTDPTTNTTTGNPHSPSMIALMMAP